MSYLIVKKMQDTSSGKTLFTILNDGLSEIMEIENKEKAENLVQIFNQNSDSGWTYEIKEVCDLTNK
jgi:hypothetical protein